jgi:hypothetical protein
MEILTGLPWAIATFWLAIVIHELGHYVVAKSVGVIVSHVEIGTGKLLFRFTLFHDNWRVYSRPSKAFVSLFPSSKQWKNLLVYGAGPFASFLMALALWAAHPWLAFIPLYMGVVSCIPSSRASTDGYHFLKAWRRLNEKPYPKYLHGNGEEG